MLPVTLSCELPLLQREAEEESRGNSPRESPGCGVWVTHRHRALRLQLQPQQLGHGKNDIQHLAPLRAEEGHAADSIFTPCRNHSWPVETAPLERNVQKYRNHQTPRGFLTCVSRQPRCPDPSSESHSSTSQRFQRQQLEPAPWHLTWLAKRWQNNPSALAPRGFQVQNMVLQRERRVSHCH